MTAAERRQYLREADRRAQIIEAARVVVAQDWEEFSFQSVAKEAGVTRQTVYNHFDSPSQLIMEAISSSAIAFQDRLVENSAKVANGELSPPEAIRSSYATLGDLTKEQRQLIVAVLQATVSSKMTDVGSFVRTVVLARWGVVLEGDDIDDDAKFRFLSFIMSNLLAMSVAEEEGSLSAASREALLDRLCALSDPTWLPATRNE